MILSFLLNSISSIVSVISMPLISNICIVQSFKSPIDKLRILGLLNVGTTFNPASVISQVNVLGSSDVLISLIFYTSLTLNEVNS